MPPPSARRTLENTLRREGFTRIAGVDEVGRGCLAGPVTAAAVILDPRRRVDGLRDSKLLTADARARLYDRIIASALAWCVVDVSPGDIDLLNIHRASLGAMLRAVMGLAPAADYVMVDGFAIPDLQLPQRAIIKGDRSCACIAAASILAKVTRDRYMLALDREDGRYGHARHKGYATLEHITAIRAFGLSPVHRRSFRMPTLLDLLEDE